MYYILLEMFSFLITYTLLYTYILRNSMCFLTFFIIAPPLPITRPITLLSSGTISTHPSPAPYMALRPGAAAALAALPLLPAGPYRAYMTAAAAVSQADFVPCMVSDTSSGDAG